MKTLMVDTGYARGGAAQIARTIHDALNAIPEFESRFMYGRGPMVDDGRVLRFAWQPEIYLHAFLTRTTGLQGPGSWISTKRLVRLIRKQAFCLIHLHNIHGYCLDLSIAKSLARLGIPVIWTLHDGWALTGRCAYLVECDRWKSGCGRCPDLSRYPRTYLDTSAFMWKRKKAAFTQGWNPIIVCPSQWLADQVKESYLRKSRIEVIPNAIDTETFTPRGRVAARKRLALPLKKRVVLLVAADLSDKRKGVQDFFDSLRYVKDNDLMVLTLGKRVDLTGGLSERIEVRQLGYIADRGLLAEAYSAADVFCVSSLDENFPSTVLESLACGTAVVGFRVGGIPEQVTEDCGILVEPGDVEALAAATTRLLEDSALTEKMGYRCREKALAEYSVDKLRDRYVSLYHEIAAGGR